MAVVSLQAKGEEDDLLQSVCHIWNLFAVYGKGIQSRLAVDFFDFLFLITSANFCDRHDERSSLWIRQTG